MGNYELSDENQDYHSCLYKGFCDQVLNKLIKKVNLKILAAAIGQTEVVKIVG